MPEKFISNEEAAALCRLVEKGEAVIVSVELVGTFDEQGNIEELPCPEMVWPEHLKSIN